MSHSEAWFLAGRDLMWMVIYLFIPTIWSALIIKPDKVFSSFNLIVYWIFLNVLSFYLGSHS